VNSADIQAQVGAAQGLWTHSPVDWAGNEGWVKAAQWPNNAAQGYLGIGNGTRPGGGQTQTGPAGAPTISEIIVTNVTTTSVGIAVKFGVAPTSCSVNYGLTQAVASNIAGTATATQTITLTPLTSQTTYYFNVQATNAQGTSVSTMSTFRTA
jgi:hypothetical protein